MIYENQHHNTFPPVYRAQLRILYDEKCCENSCWLFSYCTAFLLCNIVHVVKMETGRMTTSVGKQVPATRFSRVLTKGLAKRLRENRKDASITRVSCQRVALLERFCHYSAFMYNEKTGRTRKEYAVYICKSMILWMYWKEHLARFTMDTRLGENSLRKASRKAIHRRITTM